MELYGGSERNVRPLCNWGGGAGRDLVGGIGPSRDEPVLHLVMLLALDFRSGFLRCEADHGRLEGRRSGMRVSGCPSIDCMPSIGIVPRFYSIKLIHNHTAKFSIPGRGQLI